MKMLICCERVPGEMNCTHLGCGGDELCYFIQAVQMRNELQPQVHLKSQEKNGNHIRSNLFNAPEMLH